MEIYERLKSELISVQKNVSLKGLTSMQVGGKTRYLYIAKDIEHLVLALKIALELKLPYFILGQGTNVVFSEEGFRGLLIKNETHHLAFEGNVVVADSGINLQRFIRKLAEADLGGFEFLAGIPGSLGGAIYGNAGAYGRNIGEMILFVTIFDPDDGKIKKVKHADLRFNYRSSIFKLKTKQKGMQNRPVILSIRLRATPCKKDATLRLVSNYIKIREKKHPHFPSCGSFFKNIQLASLEDIDPLLRTKAVEGKIPVGYLLDQVGAKGTKVGKAMIAKEHANFIVNTGKATAGDIKRLADEMKARIYDTYGINLEEEVEYVGKIDTSQKSFWDKLLKREKR